jgi:hypothetical protein
MHTPTHAQTTPNALALDGSRDRVVEISRVTRALDDDKTTWSAWLPESDGQAAKMITFDRSELELHLKAAGDTGFIGMRVAVMFSRMLCFGTVMATNGDQGQAGSADEARILVRIG